MMNKSTPLIASGFILGMILFAASCSTKADFKLKASSRPLCSAKEERMVDALYEKMGWEERIAQLSGCWLRDLLDKDGKLDTAKCRKLIPYGTGHLPQYASGANLPPEELRSLIADLQDWVIHNTPNGIPILCHDEIIAGADTYMATTYPQCIGAACSFNPLLIEKKARYSSKNMRDIGALLCLGPMADITRDPTFCRNEESYGEDWYLSGRMNLAMVQGLQKGNLRKGVAACTKHFLGYGGGFESDDKEIYEEILLPHEAAIRVGNSKVLMSGYHQYRDTFTVASKQLLTGILRDYLHFDGLTVSDYGSIRYIDNFPDDDFLSRAVMAMNAGNNAEFSVAKYYPYLKEAMDKGLVSEATVEEAVKNVLRVKAAVGLLDKNPAFFTSGPLEFDTPQERQTAYDLAAESIVLLENNGTLPLGKPGKIALVGPNANSAWAFHGDYTYPATAMYWHRTQPDFEHPKVVLLKDAIQARLPEGSTLEYERGCDWAETAPIRPVQGDCEPDWDKAIRLAENSDVIVAAMGEYILLCGEGRDRGDIRLPGRQEEFVRALLKTGKPVVLLLFGGRTQVIGDIAQQCAAVIQAWYPGEEGANAVADILFGRISPSGKLCVSYPKEEFSGNYCYNYSTEQDPRIEWPFGYGLSYSSFEYSDLKVDTRSRTSSKAIRLSFNITNTGHMLADEIAQIYLSPASGQPIKPIQLQGFGRVRLDPGETQTLHFLLSPQQFGFFEDGHWAIEPGDYTLRIGASSQDMRLASGITLEGKKQTMPLRTVYFSERQ